MQNCILPSDKISNFLRRCFIFHFSIFPLFHFFILKLNFHGILFELLFFSKILLLMLFYLSRQCSLCAKFGYYKPQCLSLARLRRNRLFTRSSIIPSPKQNHRLFIVCYLFLLLLLKKKKKISHACMKPRFHPNSSIVPCF